MLKPGLFLFSKGCAWWCPLETVGGNKNVCYFYTIVLGVLYSKKKWQNQHKCGKNKTVKSSFFFFDESVCTFLSINRWQVSLFIHKKASWSITFWSTVTCTVSWYPRKHCTIIHHQNLQPKKKKKNTTFSLFKKKIH